MKLSIKEYYRELSKYAMGWLGWTEAEALSTDVNSILIAMEGKLEQLYPQSKKNDQLVSSKFSDFVKTHNARFSKRK